MSDAVCRDDGFGDILLGGHAAALQYEDPSSVIGFLKRHWNEFRHEVQSDILLQTIESLCHQADVAVMNEPPWLEFVEWSLDNTPPADWQAVRRAFANRTGRTLPDVSAQNWLDAYHDGVLGG